MLTIIIIHIYLSAARKRIFLLHKDTIPIRNNLMSLTIPTTFPCNTKISSSPIYNNSSDSANRNINKSCNNNKNTKNSNLRTSSNDLHTKSINTKNNNIRTYQSFISKPNFNLKSNTNNNII